jgi:hypothetical protein
VKSEAIALCKEMPVIPVNRAVDKKRIIGKRRLRKRRDTRGYRPKNKQIIDKRFP